MNSNKSLKTKALPTQDHPCKAHLIVKQIYNLQLEAFLCSQKNHGIQRYKS